MIHAARHLAHRFITPSAALLLVGVVLAACASAPGVTAAPTSGGGGTSPAANAPLFIQADTVVGSTNLSSQEASCVQLSQFARNEEIVWRAKVFDPATGKPLDDKALTSVEVRLPDQTLKMTYGAHPKTNPTDSFWAVGFTIPATYPTGALPYTVAATATDGRSGTFAPLEMAPSLLTITSAVHSLASPSPSGSPLASPSGS
jgi:hypothetical protein